MNYRNKNTGTIYIFLFSMFSLLFAFSLGSGIINREMNFWTLFYTGLPLFLSLLGIDHCCEEVTKA